MTDQMRAFLTAVEENDELRERLVAIQDDIDKISDGDPESMRENTVRGVISVASMYDFELTPNDFVVEEVVEEDVDEDELDAITGAGAFCITVGVGIGQGATREEGAVSCFVIGFGFGVAE